VANYLTREDEQNFGPELLDVAIRAARHAVSPELQRLHEENQDLQDQLNSATKLSLDRELDREVPDWRQINGDPRFHAWLLLPETYSGVIRDRLLKDAVAAGDAQRLINFFRGFLREQGGAGQAPAGPAPQRISRRALSGKPIYSRSQITEMAARRRKGLIDDAAWARWEYELIAAGREGRIVGALDIDGIPVSR
jgi:hypothetical protein